MRTAFIDVNTRNAFNALTASKGLEELGYEIRRIDKSEIKSLSYDPTYVYYGNVGFTTEAIRSLGFKDNPLGLTTATR